MLHALRSTLYGLRFTLARSNKTTVHVFIDKISVRFTHSLCYSYLHFTWGTIFTLCLTMLQYIIVHISTSLLSLKVGVCFKGLQEPEHSLKHKLILLLWMRLWLKEWVDWVLTTVRTRPGFWIRWAFTTWNTSTTLSVLQQSMVVAMARNMPDLQDSVTGETRDTGLSCVGSDMAADLQWTTMGLLSVLRCTLYTSHCCRFEAVLRFLESFETYSNFKW